MGLLLFFAVAALALTWPLGQQLDDGIPLGTESVATVPLFNLWTLAWNVESARHGYAGYWQAPIFHPTTDAFALSEPQPLTGLVALALTSSGVSILESYNLILLGALALNGFFASALLRLLGMAWLPSVAGGSLVLVLPFTHQEWGVLQLVPLLGVLLFGIAVVRFAKIPGLLSGLALGASLAVAYGLGGQVAVFCALATAPGILWFLWPRLCERETWAGLMAGGALFLLLISPLVVVQKRATDDAGFSRSIETLRKQSAQPSHYLKSPWPQWVPTPGITTAERPSSRAFWPGSLRVLLALGGLAMAWSSPTWRRPAIACAVVLLSSLLWSLGAHLAIGNLALVDVTRSIPGLAQIRSFFRFALFAQLAIAGLAAGALQLLQERWQTQGSNSRATALVAGLALFAVLEMRPVPGPIAPLPPLDLELPWLEWIEGNTKVDEALAFVPFPEGRSTRDYLGTSQWMYWQLRHWRPMVNGYSGFFPAKFQKLKKTMEGFPSNASLLALHEAGVRYCVVHRQVIERSPAPDPNGPIQLVPQFQDEEHGLAIFELRNDPV